MKTDREMTESLLKRREEYNQSKLRKGAYLRLIPKIGVPICAAVAVVTVLSLNKNLFTGDSESGKDINLVSAAPQNALLTDNYNSNSEPLEEAKVSISSNRGYSTRELMSEDIKNNPDIIVQEGVGIPEKIILDKVIYSYIDLYTFSVREDQNDMYEDAIFYPAGSVMFEAPSEDGDYTRFLSCTAFDMLGAEDYVAIVINGSIQIYAKERSARFAADNNITYEAETPWTAFSKYEMSDEVVYGNDEYMVFNAVERSSGELLKDVWIVFYDDNYSHQGYLCFSSYQTVQYLNTDGYGKVMDKSDVILNYLFKNGGSSYYNVVGSLWYNSGDAEKTENISYLGKTYERVSSENYENAVLRQLRNITINGNTFTLFEVNGRSDTVAIIENGKLSYFLHTYEIQFSEAIEPISTDELWILTERLKSNYFSIDALTTDRVNTYYESGYNAQFYYVGEDKEQYAVIVAIDGPNGADRLTIADMNSDKRVDIFIGVDDIDDYIYFYGDKVKIDFDKK